MTKDLADRLFWAGWLKISLACNKILESVSGILKSFILIQKNTPQGFIPNVKKQRKSNRYLLIVMKDICFI